MISPIYLSLDEWKSQQTDCFKILQAPENGIIFQTTLILSKDQVADPVTAYDYPTYGFHFFATDKRFFFGACLGRTYYNIDNFKDQSAFLSDVKRTFPEYGKFLESNYKSIFKTLSLQ